MSTGLATLSAAWVVGLASLALAVLLFALELKRAPRLGRGRRLLRLLATAGVLGALLWLVLRPVRWAPADARAGELATSRGSWTADPGSSGSAPDDAAQPALRFALPRAGALPPGIRPVPDAGYLARHFPELDRLTVTGHGLDPWELRALPALLTTAAVPTPRPGLERVSWERRLTLGEPWTVQGVWRVPHGAERLELLGPGGVEAMQELAASDPPEALAAPAGGILRRVAFSLTTKPRTDGHFLYRLRLVTSSPRERGEAASPTDVALDVAVEPARGPRLLWLESAPRFETRHLKNWLATVGFSLALRTTISRDRYRRETFGSAALAPARLEPGYLREYDLVVVDHDILASLPTAEIEALRAEIVGQGLGLLLLPYGENRRPGRATRRLGLDLESRPVGDLSELSVRITWPDLTADTEPSEPLTIPARELVPGGSTEPLLRDVAGRVLAARRPLGAGHVGVTLVADSFRWRLDGAPEQHHRYWSHLLTALARPLTGERWRLPAGPALLDRPWEVTLWSTQERPAASVITPAGETLPLALARDASEPRRWRGTLWPRETGWHRLVTEDGDGPPASESTWFHGQEQGPWQAWIEAERREATALRAARDAERASRPAQATPRRLPRELPRWPAYLLLLVSLTYLWADERFSGFG